MRLRTAFLALALAGGLACNREPAPPEPEQTVQLWSRWEGVFERAEVDPQSTELIISFRSPSQQSYRVLAFWDGGQTWRARFMPNETGVWYYRVDWRPPAEEGLYPFGAFEVVAPQQTEYPFLGRGPVQVSRNGHYFEHADSTPFFWMGDTAWNGALLATDTDWSSYLDDRLAKNFTAIQFVTTQWRTAPADAEGQKAYSGHDPITIHPEFFQRLDKRVDEVNAKGLLAVPVLLWALGDEEVTPGKLGEVDAIRLARYLVGRYGAHHVVWFLGGDGKYDEEMEHRWKRIGRAVFRESQHAPVFLHPRGRHWPWDLYREEEWLSALGYQSGHGDNDETLAWIHSGPPAQNWANEPVRPVINLEPNYEDHISYHKKAPHSAFNVRRAAYWSLLNAPTAGVSYGAHGVWSWQSEPGVPRDHGRSGVAQPWHVAVKLPGSEHMAHLSDFFQSLEWWKLRPAPNLLARQPGTSAPAKFIAVSLAEDGSFAVAYTPEGEAITFRQDPALENLTEAEWFDPRSGEKQSAQASGRSYQTPDRQDWVLVLKQPGP